MISVIFLFSSHSVSWDPSVWNNYYTMWGPGSILQTMDCYSPTTQKLTCYPNNCMSLLISLFPTPFLILSYWGSLPAEILVCGLRSSLLMPSTQSRQFSKSMTRRRAGIMSSPIHHPVCQPFSKFNQQTQQDHSCSRSPLFNRATVSIVISPETFLKFN